MMFGPRARFARLLRGRFHFLVQEAAGPRGSRRYRTGSGLRWDWRGDCVRGNASAIGEPGEGSGTPCAGHREGRESGAGPPVRQEAVSQNRTVSETLVAWASGCVSVDSLRTVSVSTARNECARTERTTGCRARCR